MRVPTGGPMSVVPRLLRAGRAFIGRRAPSALPLPAVAPPLECASRRSQLAACLPPGSVAVVPANAVPLMSQNIPYRARPNSDLLYLTGYTEPDAALVLAKDRSNAVSATLLIAVRGGAVPVRDIDRPITIFF
jgi:hypothetical protein